MTLSHRLRCTRFILSDKISIQSLRHFVVVFMPCRDQVNKKKSGFSKRGDGARYGCSAKTFFSHRTPTLPIYDGHDLMLTLSNGSDQSMHSNRAVRICCHGVHKIAV